MVDEPTELVTLREYNQLLKRNVALRKAATILLRVVDGETVIVEDLEWARAMMKVQVGEENVGMVPLSEYVTMSRNFLDAGRAQSNCHMAALILKWKVTGENPVSEQELSWAYEMIRLHGYEEVHDENSIGIQAMRNYGVGKEQEDVG